MADSHMETTVVLPGLADPGLADPGLADPGLAPTTALPPIAATAAVPAVPPPAVPPAAVSPSAETTVLASPSIPPEPTGTRLTRRQAAEVGVYAGAALVVTGLVASVARSWPTWDLTMRTAVTCLTAVALLAAGIFVRMPWRAPVGHGRRRAVAGLLTSGVAVASVAASIGLEIGQGAPGPGPAIHAAATLLAMVLTARAARTPVSESGVLAAGVWAAWLLVPAGPALWATLTIGGASWMATGMRWGRGPHTALALGAVVTLLGGIGLASGPFAWQTRLGLVALVAAGLAAFARGRAAGWLALSAGSAAVLAGSIVGEAVAPIPALMAAGVALMAVCGLGVRATRQRA